MKVQQKSILMVCLKEFDWADLFRKVKKEQMLLIDCLMSAWEVSRFLIHSFFFSSCELSFLCSFFPPVY